MFILCLVLLLRKFIKSLNRWIRWLESLFFWLNFFPFWLSIFGWTCSIVLLLNFCLIVSRFAKYLIQCQICIYAVPSINLTMDLMYILCNLNLLCYSATHYVKCIKNLMSFVASASSCHLPDLYSKDLSCAIALRRLITPDVVKILQGFEKILLKLTNTTSLGLKQNVS